MGPYQSFRRFCERLLRLPGDVEPPPGDEASTKVFLAAPNFYRYLIFLWAIKTAASLLVALVALGVPVTGAAIALTHQGHRSALLLFLVPGVALFLVMISALFRLALARLDFERRWYLVTDRSLRIREGVLTVREMTINFANIQNIALSQGPIQRALRIADLRVETAGGGGGGGPDKGQRENLHTAAFRGIDNADEVRTLIQERQRILRDVGLGGRVSATAPSVAPMGEMASAMVEPLRQVYREAQLLRQCVERA